MSGVLDRSLKWISIVGLAIALLALFAAGSARAAVYPAGGSGFNGGLEGWGIPTPASCNIPLGGLCTTTAGYDGANGNPAGSLAVDTTILVNLGGTFKSNATFESPNFTAKEGGSATLDLERQLASGNLLDLAPQATYTATLVDRTTGVSSTVITDTVASTETTFSGKGGAVKVVEGHTYAIAIAAETSSSVANLGSLGSTSLRFDNVSLTVGTSGGGGGGNSSTLTDKQLASLMQNSLIGPAVLKGNRIFVKAKCPAKVGQACKVTLQGLLKKGKPATGKRTAKIAKGKTKQLVLKVKPKLKAQVAKKSRLLFKESVKVGKAKATVYKRLKLIKRS